MPRVDSELRDIVVVRAAVAKLSGSIIAATRALWFAAAAPAIVCKARKALGVDQSTTLADMHPLARRFAAAPIGMAAGNPFGGPRTREQMTALVVLQSCALGFIGLESDYDGPMIRNPTQRCLG